MRLIAGAVGSVSSTRFQRNRVVKLTITAVSQSGPATTGGARGRLMQSAVQLSPEEQAKIGIQTTEVRRESITEDISAIGRVEEPETAFATVSTRFGGRVERLFVNFTGQPVQKGDPVATIQITGQPAGKDDPVSSIYSRDLIAAAEEYKFALAEPRASPCSLSRPTLRRRRTHLSKQAAFDSNDSALTPDQIEGVLSTSPEQPIRVTVNREFCGNRAIEKGRRRPVRQRRRRPDRTHGSQNGLGESRCIR